MKYCHHADSSFIADSGQLTHRPFVSCASRRQFLRTLGALGATAILPGAARLAAQSSPGTSSAGLNRIDVHHHLFSPTYQNRSGPIRLSTRSDPALAHWTPQNALDEMAKAAMATARLSIATGGIPSHHPLHSPHPLAPHSHHTAPTTVR